MRDSELKIDKPHVLYSKKSKKEILAKIKLHYPNNVDEKYEEFLKQYVSFLQNYRKDLGGKKKLS